MTLELARINNHMASLSFFKDYDIPCDIVACGENKGKLRIKRLSQMNMETVMEVSGILRKCGAGCIVDYSNAFRGSQDNTVVIYSPYNLKWMLCICFEYQDGGRSCV